MKLDREPMKLNRLCTTTLLRLTIWCVALVACLVVLDHAAPAMAQDPVEALLASMPVEQRVGQLFLVTFPGRDVSETSIAARLVRDLHVGGVVLRASNENYTRDATAPSQIATLTTALQSVAFEASRQNNQPFVPLFIAMEYWPLPSRAADGIPPEGFTDLPSPMAVGATWNPTNAEAVGTIIGRELHAVGVNMLLDPALDVLTTPQYGLPSNLDTAAFGGDPYWVGQMGRAFTRGVHTGSNGSLLVIAKHFPGLGSSDRRPEEEIATVQKSLDDLQRIELQPYFTVTRMDEEDPEGVVDGLQTAHIRYRGWQVNIRQLTRPISLDAQNLPTILALSPLDTWRPNGLLVSDALGVPAVRRFYEDQIGTFLPRQVAQEAFIAGHDVLFLADFGEPGDWESHYTNIETTIAWFAERYRTDPAFAERVDASLRRILRAKLAVSGGVFALNQVVPVPLTERSDAPLRASVPEVVRIAEEATTLLYPDWQDLAARLPGPPLLDETIVVFSDAHLVRDCPTCEPRPFIAPRAFEDALLQLYGPNASQQLRDENIISLTLADLNAYLDARQTGEGLESEPVATVAQSVNSADWIIFLIDRIDTATNPGSDALPRFLNEAGDQLLQKRVVVFALGAPYYLDATDVSKLTAYFALYTPSRLFITTAARLLFGEYTPKGAPPVSVPAIGYDLLRVLEPDPNQLINLRLVGVIQNDADTSAATPTPLPTITPEGGATLVPPLVRFGDSIIVRTGPILDHNGNPVPDGTPVTFILSYPNEGIELPRHERTTRNGVAETVVMLERPGLLVIRAEAPPARRSTSLLLTIQDEEAPAVIATEIPPTPTPLPTATPLPTPTPSVTPEPEPTPTPVPTPPWPVTHIPPGALTWRTFFLALVIVVGGGLLLAMSQEGWSPEMRFRQFLLAFSLGLGAYAAYVVLWGVGVLPASWGASQGALFMAIMGMLVSLVVLMWQESRS